MTFGSSLYKLFENSLGADWLRLESEKRSYVFDDAKEHFYEQYIYNKSVRGVQGVVSTFAKGAYHVLFSFLFLFLDSSSATGPPLAVTSHLWLPVAVAWNSGHALGTGFGELAKPGEGSWRVSNPRWV